MSLKAALQHHLQNDVGVRAAGLSQDGAGEYRVYVVGEVPTDARNTNIITYQKIGNDHARHLKGGSGIAEARYQLECMSDTPSVADALAEAVRESLDNHSGSMGATGSEVVVRVALLDNDFSDTAIPQDGTQVVRHREVMDFDIWYEESITG